MPQPESPNDLVIMHHPDIEALSAPTLRSSFDELYAGQGWEVAEVARYALNAGEALEATPVPAPPAPSWGSADDQ